MLACANEIGRHTMFAHPPALKAYMPTSTGKPEAGPLATNTMPLAMEGDDSKPEAKLTPVHGGSHSGLPQPPAGNACSTPMFWPGVGVNWVAVKTVPFHTAGVVLPLPSS